mmetsp:Transcript_16704/g.36246  ORF Transcript_16704/g.36246 Transcript_16704/m.36246 type:complete len:82 (-) Transcript_16704:193-438(-)
MLKAPAENKLRPWCPLLGVLLEGADPGFGVEYDRELAEQASEGATGTGTTARASGDRNVTLSCTVAVQAETLAAASIEPEK